MSAQTEITDLSSLEYLSYLNEAGEISEELQGKIGVYAIFDRQHQMQYVAYSRDVYLSLKQHLIRQPDNCYWIKVQTISRPSRKVLAEIAAAWTRENGATPPGNESQNTVWSEPIDTTPAMTEEEKAQLSLTDERGKIKIQKQVARRVEADIQAQLRDRGVKMNIRFNPKLKEKGLLDLK